jgi:hypothetical protein
MSLPVIAYAALGAACLIRTIDERGAGWAMATLLCIAGVARHIF